MDQGSAVLSACLFAESKLLCLEEQNEKVFVATLKNCWWAKQKNYHNLQNFLKNKTKKFLSQPS